MKATGVCLVAFLASQTYAEQFFGEDAWTDAEVSIFRSHVAKQPKYVPVKVEFRGGTAVPRHPVVVNAVCERARPDLIDSAVDYLCKTK